MQLQAVVRALSYCPAAARLEGDADMLRAQVTGQVLLITTRAGSYTAPIGLSRREEKRLLLKRQIESDDEVTEIDGPSFIERATKMAKDYDNQIIPPFCFGGPNNLLISSTFCQKSI